MQPRPCNMYRNQNPPSCLYCCNVKAGTLMLASFVLVCGMLNMIGSSLYLSGAIQPDTYGLEEIVGAEYYKDLRSYYHAALWYMLGQGLFLGLIGGLAAFGVLKNKAGCLLPLFLAQLFKFVCTVFTIGTVIFYWSKVKLLIMQHMQVAHVSAEVKQWFTSLDDRWLAVIVFTAFFIAALVQSHLINVTYSCYKHITSQALITVHRDAEISSVTCSEKDGGPIYKLPPKYDDIQKIPLVDDVEEMDTKPPAYAI